MVEYLNGHHYAIPVTDSGVPPGTPESEVTQMKRYFPALEVRFCPTLRCWGLFQKVPISTMRKSRFIIKGNGIDPEYIFCGKLKTFAGLSLNVRRHDPNKIDNHRRHVRDIHQRRVDERANHKRWRRDEFIHLGRENKRWLTRWFTPLTHGSIKE